MKTILLSAAIFISYGVCSQPKLKIKSSPSIQPALNEVVQDYFNGFEKALGDSISGFEGTVSYESRIRIPDAMSCIVSKYPTPGTFSWEAVMYQDEDFELAAKKYNQYFKELNNSKFTPNGYEKFVLKGTYDVPDESRGFASTIMKLEAPRKTWDHFTIDLAMQYQFPNWVIKISVFEKVPDEDMRPGMKTLR